MCRKVVQTGVGRLSGTAGGFGKAPDATHFSQSVNTAALLAVHFMHVNFT